jgi:hypothetical protein
LLLLFFVLSLSCKVFTHTYLKKTMFLGNTVSQLFCSYGLWCI